VYLSPYYEVWQRSGPVTSVVEHVPFAAGTRAASVCGEIETAARRAGAGAEIAYTTPTSGFAQFDSADMSLSSTFLPSGGPILATGAGHATGEESFLQAGMYELFLGGSIGRPVDVRIDGRLAAKAAYQVSYPDEWILIGTRRLSAGEHRVEITRGGFSLHAGNGNGVDGFNRTVGPLLVLHAGGDIATVHYSSVSAFAGICRSPEALRWAEVVRSA
jgi:hypothetical protein